jgi:hypothetical protein
MKVRNKATGVETHVRNNSEDINALIRLGFLEVIGYDPGDLVRAPNGQVIPAMQPAPQPTWLLARVTINQLSHKFEHQGVPTQVPAITFTVGSSAYEQYTGEPKEAHKGFGLRTVPADILKQYAKAYKEFYGK